MERLNVCAAGLLLLALGVVGCRKVLIKPL